MCQGVYAFHSSFLYCPIPLSPVPSHCFTGHWNLATLATLASGTGHWTWPLESLEDGGWRRESLEDGGGSLEDGGGRMEDGGGRMGGWRREDGRMEEGGCEDEVSIVNALFNIH